MNGNILQFKCLHTQVLSHGSHTHFLQVEEDDIVKRLLPGKMDIWRRKRDRKVERRTLAREKKLREWVSAVVDPLKDC